MLIEKPSSVQAGEGADQRHRHRQHRDQRGAPGLQEDEHDGQHDQRGFDDRRQHLLDRGRDEQRGVVGNQVVDAGRKPVALEFGDLGPHRFAGVQCIGTAGQQHRQRDRRLAVDAVGGVVALRAELDPRHVFHAQHAARAVRAQHDVAEGLGFHKAPARGHGELELLPGQRRRGADLAGGELGVLRLHGRGHVGRRDAERGHAVGLQPQPHRVVARTEDEDVGRTGHALQVVDDVLRRVVRQVQRVARQVGRIDGDHEQEVVRLLGHLHAIAAHLVGQAWGGALDAVVDIEGGLVDVGADLEGGRDRHLPVRGRARVEVQQVLDPRELFFDRCGHGARQRFGRRAGVGGNDLHRRRRDLGVLRDRQRARRHQAGEHDDDGQHRGEHRPLDEEAREHGRALSSRAWRPPQTPPRAAGLLRPEPAHLGAVSSGCW